MKAIAFVAVVVPIAACGVPCEKDGDRCVLRPASGEVVVTSEDEWNALGGVTDIEGDLVVRGIAASDDAVGLSEHGLQRVDGNVTIEDNPGLRTFGVFFETSGVVRVTNNPALAAFDTVALDALPLDLEIRDAPALTFAVFEFPPEARLVLADVPALEDVIFSGGETLSELTVERTGLSDVPTQTSTSGGPGHIGALTLRENPKLRSALRFGATVESVDITANDALTHLGQLLQLLALDGGRIVDNATLPACQVDALAFATGADVDNAGNDDDAACVFFGDEPCDADAGFVCNDGLECSDEGRCFFP